jgi:hypothetical protein
MPEGERAAANGEPLSPIHIQKDRRLTRNGPTVYHAENENGGTSEGFQ